MKKKINRNKKAITINAVGDIGLIGKVSEQITVKGFDFPFAKSANILKTSDIVFGNLEMPFVKPKRETYSIYESKKGKVPPDAVNCLKHAGINLLSLANNHIMDWGPSGIKDTISILDNAGIAHAGAGMNLNEARKPAIVKANNMTIGFLSYTMKGPHIASNNSPGAAPIDLKIIIPDLERLLGRVDTIIVSLHFGMIYTDFPTTEQQELCHLLIDKGVSLILGHHPHVLQGLESYKSGLIAYSLGEYIFDATFGNVYAKIAREKRKESGILSCKIENNTIVNNVMIPFKLNEFLQPTILIGEEALIVEQRLNQLSLPLEKDSLNDKNVFANAGNELVPYQMQVYMYHLKRLNLGYIIHQIFRIRLRHLKLLFGFIKVRLLKK